MNRKERRAILFNPFSDLRKYHNKYPVCGIDLELDLAVDEFFDTTSCEESNLKTPSWGECDYPVFD